jgi:thiaminase
MLFVRRATFQHYVLQDAFFLDHFAKAYAAAIDKLDAASPSIRQHAAGE